MSEFQEAKAAVAKLLKDYQPIERLAEALVVVEAKVLEIGDLEHKRASLLAEIDQLHLMREAAETEANKASADRERAQEVLDKVKATLASFRL